MQFSGLTMALRMLRTSTKVALGLGALGIVIVLWNMGPVFGALFSSHLTADAITGNDGKDADKAFDQTLASNEQLFIDRSIFYKPAAPPPAPVKQTETSHHQDTGPTSAPPYSGPKLVGLIGDMAIFDRPVNGDHNTLKVGQKGGGLELQSIKGWIVDVKYEAWDYKLNLFDTVGLPTEAPGLRGTGVMPNLFQPGKPSTRGTTAPPKGAGNDGTLDLNGNSNDDSDILQDN